MLGGQDTAQTDSPAVFEEAAEAEGEGAEPRVGLLGFDELDEFRGDLEEFGAGARSAWDAKLTEVGMRDSIDNRPGAHVNSDASKPWGNSSRIVNCAVRPCKLASVTVASGANSQSNCRQAPQGGVSRSVSATTAMAVKRVRPSEIPFTSATRSAQIVRP